MNASHYKYTVAVVLAVLLFGSFLAFQTGCRPKPGAPGSSTDPVTGPSTGQEERLWLTDYAAAVAKAKAENKPLFLLFTGTDWCFWCVKLENEVLCQPDFLSWAKDNLVLVKLDFPHNTTLPDELKKQNNQLAEQYQIAGFPTVKLVSPNGMLINEIGYEEGGPQAYVDHLKSLLTVPAAAK